MTQRVLVTGGQGFIGRAIVAQLVELGCVEVLALTRQAPAANQTFLVSDGQDLSTTELVRGMAQAAGGFVAGQGGCGAAFVR